MIIYQLIFINKSKSHDKSIHISFGQISQIRYYKFHIPSSIFQYYVYIGDIQTNVIKIESDQPIQLVESRTGQNRLT